MGDMNMNFEEIVSVLKERKPVRRRAWSNKYNNMYLYFDKFGCLWKRTPQKRYTISKLYVLCLEDLNATDWEEREVREEYERK